MSSHSSKKKKPQATRHRGAEILQTLHTFIVRLSPWKILPRQNPPNTAGQPHSSILETPFTVFSSSPLLHQGMQGRDSSWDVLSYLAPKPIHPPLLPFSVICRRSGNERFPPSEKTSPSTDTFYIWTAAPPSSPLLSNFLSVAVSCDLLSTPIREVRWKTRGGEGTLLLTSSSFLSLSFWNVRRETERVGWDFRCVANCLIQLPLETVMRRGRY